MRRTVVVCALVASVASGVLMAVGSSATTSALVADGGFEDATFPSAWTASNVDWLQNGYGDGGLAAEGGSFIDLNGTGAGSISQTVAVSASAHYLLSYAYTGNPSCADAPVEGVSGTWDAPDATTPTEVDTETMQPGAVTPLYGWSNLPWRQSTVQVVGSASGQDVLAFNSTNPGSCGIMLDAIQLTPLPASYETVSVSGKSDPFDAGFGYGLVTGASGDLLADGADGTPAPSVGVTAGHAVTFPSNTGIASIGCVYNQPDGGNSCGFSGMTILPPDANTPGSLAQSWGASSSWPIAGMVDNNQYYSVIGVFTDGHAPFTGMKSGSATTTPTSLTYDDTTDCGSTTPTTFTHFCASAAPALNQPFFIGDGYGLDSNGNPVLQQFVPPVGATRLYFGMQDTPSNGLGQPNAYFDDSGAFNLIVAGATSGSAATDVPLAPTLDSAVAGIGDDVTVSWTANSTSGAPAVTDWLVDAYNQTDTTAPPILRDLGSATIPAAGYDFTGLTDGDSYTFRVQGVNVTGAGVGSASSGPATATTSAPPPSTTPAAPPGLKATGSDVTVDLSWTAPSDNGDSAITGYDIREYAGTVVGTTPTATIHSAGPGTTYNVTPLTNGQPYTFTVSAVNANGAGTASDSATATPSTTPQAPTGLQANGSNVTVVLSWTAPSDDGGNAIAGYDIKEYVGTTVGTTPTTTIHLSGTGRPTT